MQNSQKPLQKIFRDATLRSVGSSAVSLVARQPIFDSVGKVCAYELLFRDPGLAGVSVINSHSATSRVMIDGFNMLRPSLLPGQRFFINFTEELLEAEIPSILPPNVCALEILETVTPSQWVLQSLHNLKSAGYTIALDDYFGQESLKEFLPLADVIKIDVLQLDEASLRSLMDKLKHLPAKLLAEKVENVAMESLCKDLGFTLFQGFFFCKPELITGKKITPSQITKARLLAFASKEDVDVREVTKTIQADVSLTLKLLSYVNSVYFGLPVKVKNVQHAVMLLGCVRLMQWLYVTTLADMDSAPLTREIAYLSALRAKFLTTMGEKYYTSYQNGKNMPSLLFLTGLFSFLESILQIPFAAIANVIPMEDDVIKALEGSGPLAPWVELMEAYEHGDWKVTRNIAKTFKLSDADLAGAYTEAAVWSSAFYGV